MKKKVLTALGVFLALILVFLIVRWPRVPILAWQPPTTPKPVGILAPNEKLTKTVMLGGSEMLEPEDSAFDKQGRLYGSCDDGKIRRILKNGKTEVFADTKGRPLGIEFAPNGDLIVADVYKGLVSINPKGKVTVLADSYKGKKMIFVDDVDVDKEGVMYFTDASTLTDWIKGVKLDMLSRTPTGRVFSYHPKTKKLTLLLDKLYFANGITLSHDEDYLLVNETANYSVRRYWLKGPKKGKSETIIKNLPGFPDNVDRSSTKGEYWVSLATPRVPAGDKLHPNAFLKKLVLTLPDFLLPQAIKAGKVLRISVDGKILETLQDTKGKVIYNITSTNEVDGYLYFGHIYHHSTGIGKYKLPKRPVPPAKPAKRPKASPKATPTPKTKQPTERR